MRVFEHVRIETPRLVLRTFTPEDADDFFRITRDPAIYETLPEDHMYDRDEINGIIAYFTGSYPACRRGDVPKFSLAIELRDSRALIGDAGIGRYSGDDSVHEVFYFLNPAYWGKGYGSEAVAALLEYVKQHTIVDRLIGTVVPNNAASARILRKNGFAKIPHSYSDARDFYELVLGGEAAT